MTRVHPAPRALAVWLALAAAGCAPAVRNSSAASPSLAERLSGMIWPLPIHSAAEVTSGYGFRGRRHHDGLDIDGRTGDPVFAARDGRVAFSGWKGGYGLTVVVDHGGKITTLYGHNSRLLARVGERVERGQAVAVVGATGDARGDHLHFEVAWAGVPLDPVPLLPRTARR